MNPDNLQNKEENHNVDSTYRAIVLDDKETLSKKTRNLDYYQRKVIEAGINYARVLRKSLNPKNKRKKPPNIMVHGGAGCGKSTVINILKQWIHLILQRPGDNPSCPYVLVGAPTGTAAANVKGQTMHSLFSFPFGNEHFSLSDKKRDKTRAELKDLKMIIIDEISMVKADQLFQLDLRLREITQKPMEIFGGVSIFCLGDILQLQPCMARYIFEEPLCDGYKLAFDCKTHWQSFEVINLEENHRQQDDHEYANILNRIRIGDVREEDMAVLETRIRPENHSDLEGAMYLSCTNASVQKHNKARLNEIKSELISIEAINIHPTIRNFKPSVDNKAAVKGTSFLQTLEVKVGARVMLTYNIDVSDCLTNGARGCLIGIEKDKRGNINKLFVKFDEDCQGALRRKASSSYNWKFPGCTIIEKVMFSYSLSKKSTRGSNTAKVYQFPIVLCFAATAHKFQGQTIVKPNKLAVDLRTVFKPAMAYVMLSRIQDISQLFILDCLPVNKIYACDVALEELERLERISKNKNPTIWEKANDEVMKMSFLNCHSLLDKFEDIKSDSMLLKSDIICLSETWLKTDQFQEDLNLRNYNLKLNSISNGKGLATYFKLDIFKHEKDIKLESMQLSKFSANNLDVISVYRSKEGNERDFIRQLKSMLSVGKVTVISGDFNICLANRKSNQISSTLQALGFKQLVNEATHIEGGHLDHIYIRGIINAHVELYSPYYTALDHDALCLSLQVLDQR